MQNPVSFSRGNAQRAALLHEIDRHLNMPAEEVPDSHRFLLEIDLSTFEAMDIPGQEYWLLAAQAARRAGRRAVRTPQRGQKRSRGAEVGPLSVGASSLLLITGRTSHPFAVGAAPPRQCRQTPRQPLRGFRTPPHRKAVRRRRRGTSRV